MGFNATGNYIYSQKTDGWFLFHKFSPSDRVRELLQTNNSGDTECIHNKKCPGISNSINEQYLQETKENKSQRFYILSFFHSIPALVFQSRFYATFCIAPMSLLSYYHLLYFHFSHSQIKVTHHLIHRHALSSYSFTLYARLKFCVVSVCMK